MTGRARQLEDRVAIVTGGAAGIGRGIAHCLASEGARVAILDVDRDEAARAAAHILESGGRALAVHADLTDGAQVLAAVQAVRDDFGQIDILVNNVGGAPLRSPRDSRPAATDFSEDEWQGFFELNLKSHVLATQAVVPHLVAGRGRIVNIASILAQVPEPSQIAYSTLKAAVAHYTRNLAKGLAPRDFFLHHLVPLVPLGREQSPEDIGWAVAYLVSDRARNITGQTLFVDGGMSLR